MHKKILLLSVVIFLFIGWSNNPGTNTSICTADNEQNRPHLVPDGNGGAVITWEDFRSGTDPDIYAQAIDSSGATQWRRSGIEICGAIGPQRHPRLTADNRGGVIITWLDRRNGKDYDIYAQRIDANGRYRWTEDGVALCTVAGDQYDPVPVPSGNGGAIIIWQDRRNGNNYDIYAQRIDSSGRVQWNENGVIICSDREDQENPRAVSDGNGGAVITWQDRRNANNYNIYAQRINAAGQAQWTANGVEICSADYDQRGPRLVSDNRGGAVITWQDKRNGKDYDVYAQRVDTSGRTQWTENGVAICSAENSQYDPCLASDARGGAVIAWQDYRKGTDCNFDAFAEQSNTKTAVCEEKHLNDWNIYAQHINSSGKVQWAANGVAVSTANVDQYRPQAAPDGFGGTIILWRAADKKNEHNIYAQRLNASGNAEWSQTGVAVSTAEGDKYGALAAPDGKGGAIVTWYNKKEKNNSNIYAQKVCASGEIGGCYEPVAVIDGDKFEGEAALTINFNGTDSYDPDGRITAWRWSFGDGQRASTQDAVHTYSTPGSYTVTLRVRDNNGKWSSTVRRRVTVNAKS
jgi:hypothetical protein